MHPCLLVLWFSFILLEFDLGAGGGAKVITKMQTCYVL